MFKLRNYGAKFYSETVLNELDADRNPSTILKKSNYTEATPNCSPVPQGTLDTEHKIKFFYVQVSNVYCFCKGEN
jgi:hypothetical protein